VTKRAKHTAYLIAVHQRREGVRVYAILAPSAAVAMAQVYALAADDVRVEVVGSLGRDLARRLDLKLGEICLI